MILDGSKILVSASLCADKLEPLVILKTDHQWEKEGEKAHSVFLC